MSGILGGAEDDDGVRRTKLLEGCSVDDADAGQQQEGDYGSRRQHRQPQEPAAAGMLVGAVRGHPLAKKPEISSDGIAPSRRMRQRESLSVRSTMVDATSRGDVPPSTMMLMRP